jgi:hypothetical protein
LRGLEKSGRAAEVAVAGVVVVMVAVEVAAGAAVTRFRLL